MKWIAAELHTHTRHSDGAFSVEELCRRAKREGLDAIAITDHNTKAPLYDLTPELEKETLPVIHGMEWTTFFGHLCVLGDGVDVDWRDATPGNIASKLKQIRAGKGLCGIAHPFHLGSPMCTGCYWDYRLSDYSDINYMEVWSGKSPSLNIENARATELWISLLDCGYRIGAAYGRDWHAVETDGEIRAVTCLRVPDGPATSRAAFDAIKRGGTQVALGPALELRGPDGEGPGDSLDAFPRSVEAWIDADFRRRHWEMFGIEPDEIRIIGDAGRVIARHAATAEPARIEIDNQIGYQQTLLFNEGLLHKRGGVSGRGWLSPALTSIPAERLNLSAKPIGSARYIRAELWGKLSGEHCPLAMTSPMYVLKE